MNSKSSNVERVTGANSNIFSPFSTPDGDIFFACQSGEILRHKDGQMKIEFTSGGQPSAFHLDKTGKTCFIADLAHQAIFSKNIEDKTSELSQLVKDFEGEPFLGPHSLALTDDMNLLYFTDCGPWGETSIENPKGSVFLIDLEASLIRP